MKTKHFKTLLKGTLAFLLLSCTTMIMADTPTITKKFTITQPGELEVTTSGGGITVEGTDGNEVTVETYVGRNGKTLSADDEIVKNLSEGYDLKIEQEGNKIIVKAKRIKHTPQWQKVYISFKVYTPYQMTSNLVTSGGGIEINKLTGTQKANTSGGGIKLVNNSGEINANTSGGGIKVYNHKGDLDVNTSGGGIKIEKSEGNIKGVTSGGGITVTDVKGKVNVSTSGGGIKVSGYCENLSASTSGGGITADVTGLKESIHLSTSGGPIHATIPENLGLDLDLSGNHVNVNLQNFSGEAKKNRVSGTMNGGGISVYMYTSGGGVDLNFQ